jgi:hypothetical protein
LVVGRGRPVILLTGVLVAGLAWGWMVYSPGVSRAQTAGQDIAAGKTTADNVGGAAVVTAAKYASAKGKWTLVHDAMAGGGAYMSAGADGVGTSLEFPIDVDKPTEIAVTPVWFMHGDQTKARRFPDTSPYFYVQQEWAIEKGAWDGDCPKVTAAPVVSKPGPDAIVALGNKAYFTAPAGGKIGVLDLATRKVTGAIDVGSYVADIVADADRGELLVAEAASSVVGVFALKDGKKLAEIAVPELPYSLALDGGKLYVACMAAKKIAVVDVAARKVTQSIDLPVGPQNVAFSGEGGKRQLIVHLLPMAFDIKTSKEVLADRLTYWPSFPYVGPPEKYETDALAKAAAAFPKARIKTFLRSCDWPAEDLDAGPSHGFVRVEYDPQKKHLVFILDDGFKGLIIFHPEDGRPPTKIDLGETPADFQAFDRNIYAFCKQSKKVQIIDIAKEKLVDTLSLPVHAEEFFCGCLVRRYSTAEYYDGAEEQAGKTPGRIIVGPTPLAFDAATLAPAPAPAMPFFPYERRSKAALAGGPIRQLSVDNLHTIRVEEKSSPAPKVTYIDTSAVTDYHVANNPARLMPGDQPGAITLSIDGGPECDWENDVWFTPDQRVMLVRGTGEFGLWNAVRFSLAPGKHVLKVKACSPYVNLEGVRINRTLSGAVDAKLTPLPQDVQGKVEFPCYGGTFLADESASFRAGFDNKTAAPQDLKCEWAVRDYRGQDVLAGQFAISAAAGKEASQELKLDLKDPGRYTLRLKYSSPEGQNEVFHRFVKLPKLDYPRLLMRADDSRQIRDRIAKYPVLFQRFRDYLSRQSEKADWMPKKFRGSWGQEQILENAKWRPLCLEFADLFLEPAGAKKYQGKLLPLATDPGGYDTWQGNYEFGGPQTLLYDLMMNNSPAAREKFDKSYRTSDNWIYRGDYISGGVIPDYLEAMKEPLTPQDRYIVWRVAMELNNYDAYFQSHAGSRGGNWFHGVGTNCHCPIHSMTRTFLLCRNFFGEKEFFERTNIRGVLSLLSYAYPRYDTHTFLVPSAFREFWTPDKITQPMRWALSGLSRLPLEKTYYKEVFDCIDKLSGPMKDEAKEVDALLDPSAYVVVPLYLAMGWVDPDVKAVAWEEMPPSMFFDGEGAACMKSGWDKNMTDIYFVSGLTDISYRNIPNHFQVFKAGEMVVGTAGVYDHGGPVQMYGNCAQVGDTERFADYLVAGGGYDRGDERKVTDCFSTLGTSYMFRDWRLSGFRQSGTSWEGGGHPHAYPREVVMHSHTQHPFIADGGVLAYETSPAFDYVAGDATNSWPLEDVQQAYRQLVFVRPDVIVIYDRLLLGDKPKGVKWPLMTVVNKTNADHGYCPVLKGDAFSSSNKVASLWGKALLPKGGKINSTTANVVFFQDGAGYIEIRPPAKSRQVEYLVVLRTGLAEPTPLECSLVEENGQAGAAFAYEGRNFRVLFNREGAVGGHIRVEDGGKALTDRALAQGVRDTYENWKGTSMFDKWMSEDRFKSYVTEADRKRFGK